MDITFACQFHKTLWQIICVLVNSEFHSKMELLDVYSSHEISCDISNWTSHHCSDSCGIHCCLFPSSRFGDGYTIILRLWDSNSSPDSCPVSAYMKSSFPSIELKERHENILQYQLPSHACCLARVFDLLSNNYEELGIADFSVSQTTLDQVRMIVIDEGNISNIKAFCAYPVGTAHYMNC